MRLRKQIEIARRLGAGEIVQKNLSDTFESPFNNSINEDGFNNGLVDSDTLRKKFTDIEPEPDERKIPLGENPKVPSNKSNNGAFE